MRVTRHKARGIETEHPAVFPVALPDFLMRAYADEGDIVFEPFAGAGSRLREVTDAYFKRGEFAA